MCGFAGEVRFDDKPVPTERISVMTRMLARRGPDAEGIIMHGNVGMGHRRLKIIDLSDRGQQPMEDPALELTLVFNGCIYNHRELRRDLEGQGYLFFSDSDTEVVLKGYHAWGENCVERFNGMFAFVIHERDTGKIFMARDRLGIKPLYYIRAPGVLRFASTMPALLRVMAEKPEIDHIALHHYMNFHSIVPAPRTIFKEVMKLPPATTRTFAGESGAHRDRCYWRPEFDRGPIDAYLNAEEDLIQALLDQMRFAVRRRMVADVPVGVLLSGGVDSSLVAGLLAEMGEVNLKTFSVGFEDTKEEAGNEFEYSDIVAEEFRTDHEKIMVDTSEMLESLPDCILAMSEPMVSHDNIGFYLLAKHVSQCVSVVQSGQGADEIFGGYHWYHALEGSRAPVEDYATAFFDRTQEQLEEVLDDRYIEGDYSRSFVASHFDEPGAPDSVDKALRIDTTVMLVDDPVKRVDNMTMAWGLEARVPYLDHELVELAARIPPALKLKNGGKYLLKEAARRIVPDAVVDRPKGSFPVPALKYLRGRPLEFVADALNSDSARERGLFKRPYLDRLLQDPTAHITPLNGSGLWQLGTLEFWLQAHGC